MASKRRRRRALERSIIPSGATVAMAQKPLLNSVNRTDTIADLIKLRSKHETIKDSIIPEKPVVQTATLPDFQNEEPKPIKSVGQEQKEQILKIAKENRGYYEYQEECNNHRKPWFQYVKNPFQYSEFVLITPKMAAVMLEHLWRNEEGNRHLKHPLVAAYKRDLENDNWIPTNEGISINLDMEVFDGQHRLHAIVEANKPCALYVTWNVLPEAKFVVDSGAKRNINEKLSMVMDLPLASRTPGVCKAMMRGVGTKTLRFSETEVAEFAHKYQHVLAWLAENLPLARAEVLAAIGKAYLWYGPEKIADFCYRLKTLSFNDGADPAKALYLALSSNKGNKHVVTVSYKKTLQALDCCIKDREISKLYQKEDDIFTWLPGWELPKKEPLHINK